MLPVVQILLVVLPFVLLAILVIFPNVEIDFWSVWGGLHLRKKQKQPPKDTERDVEKQEDT